MLLIDERPEEATAWREALPDAEIATATADLAPAEQVRLAELALERPRRRAEAGADVVLIVDSLSRLAVARATPPRSSACSAPGASWPRRERAR